jgi:hypothetical protein
MFTALCRGFSGCRKGLIKGWTPRIIPSGAEEAAEKGKN